MGILRIVFFFSNLYLVRPLVAIDFLVVPTITFRLLYCLVVMRHDRRRVIHFNVTEHPSARWAAQQIIQAFPYDEVHHIVIITRLGRSNQQPHS